MDILALSKHIQEQEPKRIGVLGGTFDPIHLGHLKIAEAVKLKHDLDLVLLIPAKQNPLKSEFPGASAEDRLKMVELASIAYEWLVPCSIEIDQKEPSYTVDTLESLRQILSSDKKLDSSELYLLIGQDNLVESTINPGRSLRYWKDLDRIFELAKVVCVSRIEATIEDFDKLNLKAYSKDQIQVLQNYRVIIPPIPISSTECRERIKAGLSITGMLPDVVQKYVEFNGLYQ